MDVSSKLTFNPRQLQWDFIITKAEYPCLQGEFNSGKTRTCVSKAIKLLLNDFPGCTGICIRNYIADLRDSTVPQFFQNYWGAEDVPLGHNYNRTNRTLIFPNGSKILFIALDKEKDVAKLKNMVFTFAWLEQAEEILPEVFDMCTARNRQQMQGNTVFCSANNEEGSWINEYFFQNEIEAKYEDIEFRDFKEKVSFGTWQGKNSNYLGIREKPMVNRPNIRPDYYEKMTENLTADAVKRYVFNKATGKGGLVYPFTDDNIIEDTFDYSKPSEFWKFMQFQDYGISETDPMVWLWCFQDMQGDIIIANEYYEYSKGIYDVCDYVGSFNRNISIDSEWIVGCPRTFQKEGTSAGRNAVPRRPADLFQDEGLFIEQYPIHFDVRQPIIEGLFKSGRLKIHRNCVDLIKELRAYKWKNIKTASNHAIEALERGVSKLIRGGVYGDIEKYNKDERYASTEAYKVMTERF